MSKMKKVLAVILTAIMVMAMGMTSFAEGKTATITVTGAENATKTMVQIIQPNQTTKTGWEFINGAGQYYQEAFNQTDEQLILAALIKKAAADEGKTVTFTDASLNAVTAATAAPIDNALSKVAAHCTFKDFESTVSVAGVYAIKATETGFTYKTMAAYVGFGVAPSLNDATINAKKAPTTITKENADPDKAVAIGDHVEFTVKTSFPYVDVNATTKEFKIFDTLTGADFDLENGVLKNATVTVGGENVTLTADNFTVNGRTFTLDLSSYIDATNSNAGDDVVVTYTATVKEVDVKNEVHSTTNETVVEDHVYTGTIEFTKYAEDGKTTLKGAGFNVLKDDTVLKFTQDKNAETGEVIPGEYTYDPNGTVTEVFVNDNGLLVVKGLDKGTYHFAEKTAPEGYSINAEGKDVTLAYDGEKATATFTEEDSMTDTKLSSLPSTGGIGTTIFTIGGCLIMIAAAALFFASRKRSQK